MYTNKSKPYGEMNSMSLIAVQFHGIALEFSDNAEMELKQIDGIAPGDRADLRNIPFITIDPENARDHDDAIYACKDLDPANQGGFLIWVAIADVAHFVRPNTVLDKEAKKRGNSTYFPDMVAPMLPEKLSNNICSLQAEEDRLCIAVRISVSPSGDIQSKQFMRGIMRSVAALTYREAEDAIEQREESSENGGPASLVRGLYEAYEALKKSRKIRSPLDIEIAEGSIAFGADGVVASISRAECLESNRLVEEFMILANICAAEVLENHRTPFLSRVHDNPAPEKIIELRNSLRPLGIPMASGAAPKTRQLNQIISRAGFSGRKNEVCSLILRSMSKARYSADHSRHFGLNLRRYTHFTSPIRRYADLLTHRALISALGMGNYGLSRDDKKKIEKTALHISNTERTSIRAERETFDRVAARYLSKFTDVKLTGRISSVAPFGLFIRLDEIPAEGLVPLSRLTDDFYKFNEISRELKGYSSRTVFRIGMPVTVSVADSDWEKGMVSFNLVSLDCADAVSKRKTSAGKKRRHRPKKQ